MKNLKMSTVITTIVAVVAAACILMLYLTASRSMMVSMRDTAVDNMQTSLEARTAIIEEYVDKAEKLLIAYSKAPVVAELLRAPQDARAVKAAQGYTEDFYAGGLGRYLYRRVEHPCADPFQPGRGGDYHPRRGAFEAIAGCHDSGR